MQTIAWLHHAAMQGWRSRMRAATAAVWTGMCPAGGGRGRALTTAGSRAGGGFNGSSMTILSPAVFFRPSRNPFRLTSVPLNALLPPPPPPRSRRGQPPPPALPTAPLPGRQQRASGSRCPTVPHRYTPEEGCIDALHAHEMKQKRSAGTLLPSLPHRIVPAENRRPFR